MKALTKIPPFIAKFEEIDIEVIEMAINEKTGIINEIFPGDVPYTGLWHTMSVFYYQNYRTLDGGILLVLKDQKEDSNSCLFINGMFIVKAPEKAISADMFAKFTQFLFDWVHKYVRDNNITDKNGSRFDLPAFPYSIAHFEASFHEPK